MRHKKDKPYTDQQRGVYDIWLVNPTLSRKEILLRAGYSQAVAHNPKAVFESKGLRFLMSKHVQANQEMLKPESKDVHVNTWKDEYV